MTCYIKKSHQNNLVNTFFINHSENFVASSSMYIHTRACSIDKEASIYLPLILTSKNNEPKIIKNTRAKNTISKCKNQIICNLCGFSGHLQKDCPGIPSIEQMEDLFNEDVTFAENDLEKTGNYLRDQFGLFSTFSSEGNPIIIDGNFNDDEYCINCGLKGHTNDRCDHMSIAEIIYNMNECHNEFSIDMKNKFFSLWDWHRS
ncbi:hypothetical protein TRFO_28894 [Tritrichomonas foetus]|uniref:CCHC-type domain-containing protein n=1 Tax=Tritrichomonas foetus TaxID=1144522 RepID=A0A1J4JXC6_9EUKA|nr:hypothetical protein TRFO_28894 [Tritrichomonas foetus]|eukprot:OHT03643.1 hypothetical protein TRFO_28894 [Tritrichomonas foetus]